MTLKIAFIDLHQVTALLINRTELKENIKTTNKIVQATLNLKQNICREASIIKIEDRLILQGFKRMKFIVMNIAMIMKEITITLMIKKAIIRKAHLKIQMKIVMINLSTKMVLQMRKAMKAVMIILIIGKSNTKR